MNKHVALSIGAAALAGLILSGNVVYASSTVGNVARAQIADLHSQSTGHSVTGTMVDANGNPFYFSGLELDPVNGGTPIQYTWVQNCTTTGAFEFDNVPNGTYRIHYYMPEYQVASPSKITVSHQSISGLVIHLAEATYSISGTVQDRNGNPIANQPVTIEDPSGNIQGDGLSTDTIGSFTLTGMTNGTYTLLVGPFDSYGNPTPFFQTTVTVNNGDVNLGTVSN